LAAEVLGRPMVPSWSGEGWPLAAELARRLFVFRAQAAEALRDGPAALATLLERDYHLAGEGRQQLVRLFQQQECVSEVPDGASALVEVVASEAGGGFYLHTPLNRRGNDALARVLVLRLARTGSHSAASIVADLGLAMFPSDGAHPAPAEL